MGKHIPDQAKFVVYFLNNFRLNENIHSHDQLIPNNQGSTRRRPALIPGSWNVRTMLTGLTKDIRDNDGLRKTAVISRELDRLNVDIAALQETRLAGCGSLKEKEYTFFWQGRDEDKPREHGLGFAVSNKLLQMVEPGSTKSERLMHMKLNTDSGTTNLLSAYGRTLTSSSDAKDAFYSQLDEVIKHIPKNEALIRLGDFNARVGKGSRLLAQLPRSFWRRQMQRKWSTSAGALHPLSSLHY